MSPLSKLFARPVAVARSQGGQVVFRDKEGRVLTQDDTRRAAKEREKTWRDELRELTDDGAMLHANLLNLANGTPTVVTNPITKEEQVQVPGAMVRLEANRFLKETLHGKAVNQADIHITEVNEARMAMLKAMPDHKLLEIIERRHKVVVDGPTTRLIESENPDGDAE